MHPRESFPNSPKTRGWPERPAVPGISPTPQPPARPEPRSQSRPCPRVTHAPGPGTRGLGGPRRKPRFAAEAGECLGPHQTLRGLQERPCPHQLLSPPGHLLLLLLPAALSPPALRGDGKRVLKPDRPCGRAHGSGSRLLQTPAWAGGSVAGGTGRLAGRSPAAPAAFPRHPGGAQELLPNPRPRCQGWRLWAAALSHSLPVAQSPPATYPRAPR